MPHKLWHNVHMSQAAIVPEPPARAFDFDLVAIQKGVPLSVLEEFAAYSGIPLKDLLEVVIPPRTLKHRRQRGEPLNMDESDRLARVSQMYELAKRVYGDSEGGRKWLLRPKRRFDGKTALSMLRTGVGGQAVQDALIQIDEGYFA